MAEAEADPYTILLEEKENAIADLCIAAEAQQLLNVRDCIRKYDPSLDMEVIEREIKSCTKIAENVNVALLSMTSYNAKSQQSAHTSKRDRGIGAPIVLCCPLP